MQLTSTPADFDEVMFTLVNVLADNVHDNSCIEAIVEDLFVQVLFSVRCCKCQRVRFFFAANTVER